MILFQISQSAFYASKCTNEGESQAAVLARGKVAFENC